MSKAEAFWGARPRRRPASAVQPGLSRGRRLIGESGSAAGFASQGASKRRASGFHEAHTSLPWMQGSGRTFRTRSGARIIRRTPALVGAGRDAGYVDLALATYAMNTTGSITLLATVAQGTTINERVGKKAVWKSLQCRGSISNDTAALVTDVAFLVVYDRRPTGSLPAITDVLETARSNSFNNTQNEGRFRILKRVDHTLVGNSATAGQSTAMTAVNADFFLDLKSAKIVYKAAGTGAIGDIEEGALYFITVGDIVAGTADANMTVAFRTRFVDIQG